MPLFKRKFQFAEREVTVDFKTKTITTDKHEISSFGDALALFDCIQKLNTKCSRRYAGRFDLNLHGYKVDDDLRVGFGCQLGYYSQVKSIIDYIKKEPSFYNKYIYG